jgi:hypothetical protein
METEMQTFAFRYIFFLILLLSSFVSFGQRKLAYKDKQFTYVLLVDSTNETCLVKSITIATRQGNKKVQVIIPDENNQSCTLPKEQVFIVEDMNFDGHNDFRLLQFLPAAPNLPYYCWTYDAKRKIFVRQKSLEDITSPEFDAKEKLIVSSWRDGCCHHGSSTYKYINGKPTVIAEADIKKEDGKEIFKQKKRINGKLRVIKRTVEKVPIE